MVLVRRGNNYNISNVARQAFIKTAYFLDNSNPVYKLYGLKLASEDETTLGTVSDVLLLLGSDDTYSLNELTEMKDTIHKLISTVAGALVEIRTNPELMEQVDTNAVRKAMFALVDLEKAINKYNQEKELNE